MSINTRTIASIEAQAKSILDLAQHDTNDYESVVKMIMDVMASSFLQEWGKAASLHASLLPPSPQRVCLLSLSIQVRPITATLG